MNDCTIRLVAKNKSSKRSILKIEYRNSLTESSGDPQVDIYWFIELPYWEKDDKGIPKCRYQKAHASYHNSGEIHLINEDENDCPNDLIQKLPPPLQLNEEVDLYQASMVKLDNIGFKSENKVKNKKSEILELDTTKFGYPLYKIRLSVLPPATSDVETEIITTDYSIIFIVKKTKPWCKITVESMLQPSIDRIMVAIGCHLNK